MLKITLKDGTTFSEEVQDVIFDAYTEQERIYFSTRDGNDERIPPMLIEDILDVELDRENTSTFKLTLFDFILSNTELPLDQKEKMLVLLHLDGCIDFFTFDLMTRLSFREPE